MTDLKSWDNTEHQLYKAPTGDNCDHRLSDIVNMTILVRRILDTGVGQYDGMIIQVQLSPESENTRLYSSSKVINSQVTAMSQKGKLPALCQIRKVKNYYTL